ncbi:radical SAM/SPASM domain-containing protein [Prevotella sp. HCN-7019]|uniref:radical SAM/SPASM domain-containing protein n=1 Tax=Prevotella sp. HCN-7019 TaxID=3134668 RepID=UPI0030BC39DD
MKFSIYNSSIPLTSKTAMLYNAVSDKFIIYTKGMGSFLSKNPDEVHTIVPAFYHQLKEGGFLVDKSKDESEYVASIGKKYCTNNKSYNIIINPTTNCNFSCWYCYESHKPNTIMSQDTIKCINKFFEKKCESGIKNIHISFFGGEPLLYYEKVVRPVIDGIRSLILLYKDVTVSLHFTSNGFLVNDKVLEHLMEGKEQKSFQITLDGNKERHDKVRFSASGRGSYERIINNIKKLAENCINVNVRINYTKENISSLIYIIDDFKHFSDDVRNFIHFDFQQVWQEDGFIEDENKILDCTIEEFRKEFGRRCVSGHFEHVNTFINPCYADLKNECVVNYNGDVYKCTARDFTSENRLGYLSESGDIIWNDDTLITDRICSKFNKKVCKECRIFPICGGGCAQLSMEEINDICPKKRSELEKDNIILDRFYKYVVVRDKER